MKKITCFLICFFASAIFVRAQNFNTGTEYKYSIKEIKPPTNPDISLTSGRYFSNTVGLNTEFWISKFFIQTGAYYSYLVLRNKSNTFYTYSSGSTTTSRSFDFAYESKNSILGFNINVGIKLLGSSPKRTWSKYFALLLDLGLNSENRFYEHSEIANTSVTFITENPPAAPTSTTYTGSVSNPYAYVQNESGRKLYTCLSLRPRFYLKDLTFDLIIGTRFVGKKASGHYNTVMGMKDGSDLAFGIRAGYNFKHLKRKKTERKLDE